MNQPSSRRLLLVAGFLAAAVLACGAPAASQPEIILEPTVRPTLAEAALTTLVAPTIAAPTIAAPGATELASSAFRDDFDGTMDTGWTWLKTADPGFSLTHTPGLLRLNLSQGSFLGATPPGNVLVRAAPGGSFGMTTSLRFNPHNNYEIAGLVVVFDDGSVLQFGRGGCFLDGPPPGCIGDGLYFDNIRNGAPVGGNFATPAVLGLDYVLHLERQGNTYTASYSDSNGGGGVVGNHAVERAPVSIGLIAAQSTVAQPYADFDYFELTSQ